MNLFFERLRRGRLALLPTIALFLAAGLGFFGCSMDTSSPTAPVATDVASQTGAREPGAHEAAARPGDATAVTSPAPLPVAKTGQVVTASKSLNRLLGGTITAGRFTLVVPPLALRTNATLTVVDRSGAMGFLQCELYPEGMTFALPVVLQTRMSDLAAPLLYHTYWIQNPGTSSERWLDLGGGILPNGLGIVAPLSHFSVYRPGKYGW